MIVFAIGANLSARCGAANVHGIVRNHFLLAEEVHGRFFTRFRQLFCDIPYIRKMGLRKCC